MRRPLSKPVQQEADDGLDRTDWQDQNTDPTIPGQYECSTGGGYIFLRIWTGVTWLSTVNGAPTTVKMPWRGVKPGSIDVSAYPPAKRGELLASLAAAKLEDAAAELAVAGFEETALSQSNLFALAG